MGKIRLNVNLPSNAKQELRERMLRDGYGLREKSRWIGEAIQNFVQTDDFPQLTEMANTLSNINATESVNISSELDKELEEACIKVRTVYPLLEGVKSLVVRASIIRRLWRPSNKQM